MNTYTRKMDVLTPSTASLGLSLGGLLAGFVFLIIPRLGGNFIPMVLFGQEASDALVNTSKAEYGDVLLQFFNNDLVGQAVVFGTWMFIGLCVFVLLSVFLHFLGEINEERREMGYLHQTKTGIMRNAFTLLGYRVIVAATWTGLLMVGLRFVANYFAITGFVALADGNASDWLIFVLASLVLMITIHLQVVMIRLLMGRVRLWEA